MTKCLTQDLFFNKEMTMIIITPLCVSYKGKSEADLLCRNLGCGTVKEILLPAVVKTYEEYQSAKTLIKCSDIKNLENLWQCATTAENQICSLASVICTGMKLFHELDFN